jgi:hypothetical protein
LVAWLVKYEEFWIPAEGAGQAASLPARECRDGFVIPADQADLLGRIDRKVDGLEDHGPRIIARDVAAFDESHVVSFAESHAIARIRASSEPSRP